MTEPIYLDHNATTPFSPEVFAAMAPWLKEHIGNPSSSHACGRRAVLAAGVPALQHNGHPEQRLPNTLQVSYPGVGGRNLPADAAVTVAASLGLAGHSEHDTVSGALAAMGIGAARASGAERLSVGRTTSTDDVDRAAAALVASWAGLSGH